MLVKELIREIEGKLEANDNHVYEEVLKLISDTLDDYLEEEELTSKELEGMQEDLSYYITNEMIYSTDDIVREANRYIEDFDKILNNLDTCISEYIEISDMTHAICDMYFEAYKLVLSDILSYYIEQEHQKEYQKR